MDNERVEYSLYKGRWYKIDREAFLRGLGDASGEETELRVYDMDYERTLVQITLKTGEVYCMDFSKGE